MRRPALLALEEGSCLEGVAFGYTGEEGTPVYATGEVVFNTAITGYQEILSDPSYKSQFICLTYPQIGNVGVNAEDEESDSIYANGLIIRQLPRRVSNWRQEGDIETYLKRHGVIGIAEIDTRHLTRLLREKGALKGCIHTLVAGQEQDNRLAALSLARSFSGLQGKDLAKEVTVSQAYRCAATSLKRWHVVAYDFGIKKTILRCLQAVGCDVTVVPATTSAEAVLALSPDGVFLSNGPGDPAPCHYAIEAIRFFLREGTPLFGICLGHQLLALACGARTMKMKCGHHGANHPVKQLADGAVLITSQNHGFAVDESSLPNDLVITHRSLFDNTIQGLRHRYREAFSFQGHPEAGPGPNDARGLFKEFVDAMQRWRAHRQEKSVVVEAV